MKAEKNKPRTAGKFINKDIPCEDVIIQINAVESALHKVGQLVLEGHLNHPTFIRYYLHNRGLSQVLHIGIIATRC